MTYSNTATETSRTNKVTMHALNVDIGTIPENLNGTGQCSLSVPPTVNATAPLISGNKADRV
jgi:hypothetical protein